MHLYRTHNCGELKKTDVGKKVRLSGWIANRRDHGGVLFIDLRDHYGITQIVVYPSSGFQDEVSKIRKETVIRFDGEVVLRSPENINPKLPTGEIEIKATEYEVLGECKDLPFSIFPEEQAPEELRLRYRYLDLRRETMHQRIILRSQIINFLRQLMTQKGFLEIQTPILTSSSPEGARDFLVPSRLHPGKFYALPQAPQQFKQLLMIAGFDKYFQIAPCFRDEDARKDRSPGEFYQLDIEMSFVTQEDIFKIVEDVLTETFKKFSSWKVSEVPFPRIPYKEALLKYGTDKPDLRIPIIIHDLTSYFKESNVKVFNSIISSGGVLRVIPVKGIAKQPRSFFDKTVEFAQSIGAKGLAYLLWEDGEIKGPIAKFMKQEEFRIIEKICSVSEGDAVFFICDVEKNAIKIGREVRLYLANELDLFEKNVFKFCWIVDFPMYEYDEKENKIVFSHNPFSMPQGGLESLEKKDPLEILAWQYDIVCNGIELSSGAIRNHKEEIMFKAFAIAGYPEEEVKNKFPALLNAFKYGAPPHGGIAPGLDRMIMLLTNTDNIREVVAFPMNQNAQDLMMNAPNTVSEKQLKELHINIQEE